MKPVLDTEKEYGLVLEGGGAKGAYQIGAWKALKEAGIRIKGIAGTSVGALNGALICMGDLEKAESLWENISYSQIMSVDDKVMEDIFKQKKISRDALKDMMDYISAGGVDITPLKELIAECVDEEKFKFSYGLYIHTFSVDEMRDLNVEFKGNLNRSLLRIFYWQALIFFLFLRVRSSMERPILTVGLLTMFP